MIRKYTCKGQWMWTEFFYRSYYQWPESIFYKAKHGLPFVPTQETKLKGNCISVLLLSFKRGDNTACRLWGWGTIYMVLEIISSQIFQRVHLKKSARSNDVQNCSYRDIWLFAEVWWKQLAQMKMKGLNSPGSLLPRLYVISIIRWSTYSQRTWMNSWLWQNCRLTLLAGF